MPLSERTKSRIYETVWHLTRQKDVEGFKVGFTAKGILKRFYPRKKYEGYEHIVALADNLKRDDALDLEKEIHEWAAREAKTLRGETHVYKKYVHKDIRWKFSRGHGGNANSRCHSVYMVWWERE